MSSSPASKQSKGKPSEKKKKVGTTTVKVVYRTSLVISKATAPKLVKKGFTKVGMKNPYEMSDEKAAEVARSAGIVTRAGKLHTIFQ